MGANGSKGPRQSSRFPTPFLPSASPILAGWVWGPLGSAHFSKAEAQSGDVVVHELH